VEIESLFYNISISLSEAWTFLALGYVVGKYGSGVRFLAGVRDFSHIHSTQTKIQGHPASCPIGSGNSFLGGKTIEA
jgi:hypothetical protein